MKFTLVVGGAFLLFLGLLAYSMIPNFHNVPLESAQRVVNLKSIPVSSASLSETPQNVTVFPGKENNLLVNQTVSNSTIRVPLNASTTYYFGFDNRGSSSSKQVLLSAILVGSSVNTLVARDGGLNFAGLGMSLIGLLVTLYGVFAKTVIPWE